MAQKRTQPPLPHPARTSQKNEKWAMFNIMKVTNLFKQTGVKIAFRGKKHTRTPSQNNKHYKNTNTQQTRYLPIDMQHM